MTGFVSNPSGGGDGALGADISPDEVTTAFKNAYGREHARSGIISPSGPGWRFGELNPDLSAAYLSRFVPSKATTTTSIAFYVADAATGDHSCDVGIYDSSLTKLSSSGATAGKLNSTGRKTIALSQVLTAGTVYYAAMAFDASADALLVTVDWPEPSGPAFWGADAPDAVTLTKAASYVLPASISTPSLTLACPVLEVIG